MEDSQTYSEDFPSAPNLPARRRWRFKNVFFSAAHRFVALSQSLSDGTEDLAYRTKRLVERVDTWAASNRFIGRMFDFKARSARMSVEARAGTITFLMVAYVLAVNPQILGSTGGTCNAKELCSSRSYDLLGDSCLFLASESSEAEACLAELRMNLITATAASSLIACFIVGLFANLPLALAPGMGINIYVAYQIVGQGHLTYQQAMTAIFLEGWLFILLSLSGVRGAIMRYLPSNIAYAASSGIGLLLAFTGLRNLGIVVFDNNTLVALGGCSEDDRTNIFTTKVSFQDLNSTDTGDPLDFLASVDEASPRVYGCKEDTMRSATMWLGIAGGMLMALLQSWRVSGSIFIGVAFVTIISWIPGHAASYLGSGSPIPGGQYRMEVFKDVVAAPSLSLTGLNWDWSAIDSGSYWLALFTFLYIDLLDCTGTLLSMASLLDDCMENDAEEQGKKENYKPFMNEKREFFGQQWAFLADGVGILVGSMMGVTPLTVYIESAAGIEDGGRTGIAALVMSFFFFVSLFFSPILSSIPPYATGPALVLVGVMLIAHVDRIQWDDPLESIPAFITIILMPFTLSVAYGILAGIAAHIVLHLPRFMNRKIRSLIRYLRRRHHWFGGNMDSLFTADGSDGAPPRGNIDIVIGDLPSATPSVRSQQTIRRRVHRKFFGEGSLPRSDSDTDFESLDGRSNPPYIDDIVGMQFGRRSQAHRQSSPVSGQNMDGTSFHRSISMGSLQHEATSQNDLPRSPHGSRRLSNRVSNMPGRPQRVIIRSQTFADIPSTSKEVQTGGGGMPSLFGGGQLLDLDLDADDDAETEEKENVDKEENERSAESPGNGNDSSQVHEYSDIEDNKVSEIVSGEKEDQRNEENLAPAENGMGPRPQDASDANEVYQRESFTGLPMGRSMRRSISMPHINADDGTVEGGGGIDTQISGTRNGGGSVENVAISDAVAGGWGEGLSSVQPFIDRSSPIGIPSAFTGEMVNGSSTGRHRLPRVESAAAVRLRGLFQVNDDDGDGNGDNNPSDSHQRTSSAANRLRETSRNYERNGREIRVIRVNSAPDTEDVLGGEEF